MPRTYSLADAKSKLAELVRLVRLDGKPVTITVRGRPVAELHALPGSGRKSTAERHAELERAGLIHQVVGKPGQARFPLGVRRPGALKRFLEGRT